MAAQGHPAYAPYSTWLTDLRAGEVPPVSAIDAWARNAGLALPDGRPLRFEAAGSRKAALEFERRVAAEGVIGVRTDCRHDLWNALAWLAFPRTKAALNAVHVNDGASRTPNGRSPARDAATLLDESGVIFACEDAELGRLLRAHAWRDLFVARREQVRFAMRAYAIGHGLLDRLARPYRALTAQVLIVPGAAVAEEADASAALAIGAAGFAPASLTPLPVAALPGWDREGLGERLFDDLTVFRPPRRKRVDSQEVSG